MQEDIRPEVYDYVHGHRKQQPRVLTEFEQDLVDAAVTSRQIIRRAIFVGKFKAMPRSVGAGDGKPPAIIIRSIRREMARIAASNQWRARKVNADHS